MKSRFSLYLLTITLVISIASCRSQKKRFAIELNDSIKYAVLEYVRENNVDIKSKVITTRWVVNTFRTDVYISNSFKKFGEEQTGVPAYYSILDESIVVFLYSGVEGSISRNTKAISTEVEDILNRYQIKLSSNDSSFYRPSTWLYTFCDGKSELIKKSYPFERYYIPCGYSLKQDSIRQDSLFIMKIK